MKIISFYRLMLLLPLILPLLLLPFGLHGVLQFLLLAATFGGLQYLIFAGLFLIFSRKFDSRKIRTMLLLAPVLFVPFQLLGVLLLYLLGPESVFSGAEIVGWVFLFSFYTIVIGYLYVAMAWLLLWIFTRLNVVRD